ncbi:metal ABC transporter substrate-binding protein [Patescibacteria group bacterium]|nr:metal ABC transporter substrate-binding protein [Patescibacteria group bacterium]
MKSFFIYLLIGVGLILLIIGGLVYKRSTSQVKPQVVGNQVLQVVATVYPLADLVKQIGQNRVRVVSLLSPGVSPHTFEIKPSDIKNLQSAQAVFTIGYGLDNWFSQLADGLPVKQVYQVTKGITLKQLAFTHHDQEEGESSADPHYWLSTVNGRIMAGNIYDILVALDPAGQAYYYKNLQILNNELVKVAADGQEKLSSLSTKDLILFHESFNYLAAEFNLKVVGVFEASPGRQPTPQQLKDIYDAATRYGLKVIFSEPQFANDSLKPLLDDLHLKLFVLDPLGGSVGRFSYVDLLRYNIDTLYEALRD